MDPTACVVDPTACIAAQVIAGKVFLLDSGVPQEGNTYVITEQSISYDSKRKAHPRYWSLCVYKNGEFITHPTVSPDGIPYGSNFS